MTQLRFQDAADAALDHQLALLRLREEVDTAVGLLEGMRTPVRLLQIAAARLAPAIGPVWSAELLMEIEQLQRRIVAALVGASAASASVWQALQHGERLLREQKRMEQVVRDLQRRQ